MTRPPRPVPSYDDAVKVIADLAAAAVSDDSRAVLAQALSALLTYPKAHRAACDAAAHCEEEDAA